MGVLASGGSQGGLWHPLLPVGHTDVPPPPTQMIPIGPVGTTQSLSNASDSGPIRVFEYETPKPVRGSHPSSAPLPHRVVLVCRPAKAVTSGPRPPLASWLREL